ncbi:MAG: hypothetical protein BWX99_02996 [Deltaproteobacteria bacterium ADurb.Bin151]|nr:MAG: hypothetical protein BWX99_02996 [Deltaproteobacteria bacterium ADurb.Bin151]
MNPERFSVFGNNAINHPPQLGEASGHNGVPYVEACAKLRA